MVTSKKSKIEPKPPIRAKIPQIIESASEVAKGRFLPPSTEPVQAKYPMQYSRGIEVWVTGKYSDLIDIISNRALVYRDYVRNDSTFDKDDIHGNDVLIAVRAGRLNDLVVLYGLVYKGNQMAQAVDVVQFFVRDGQNIRVQVIGSEVFVTYGNYSDLRTRFVYSEAVGWLRSPGNNRGGSDFPPATEKVASLRLPK